MIVTTTTCVEGHNVKEYKGIVYGEVILGTNIVKDFFASINDLVGGRSASYESVLIEARDKAVDEMKARAANMGANAIIGIDLDYETVGPNSMMMVSASGTAVVID